MEAKEARELSKKAAQAEINAILKEITQACKNQNTHIRIKNISEGCEAYLLDNGFTVTAIHAAMDHSVGANIYW